MNFAATVSSTASCMYYKTIVTIPGKRMTLAMTYLHSSIIRTSRGITDIHSFQYRKEVLTRRKV